MTTSEVRRGSGGGSLTGELLIDRQALAERLAGVILHAATRVVVLHGRRSSGKTSLVRGSVVPALSAAGRRVAYGACAAALPATFEGPDGPAPLAASLAGGQIVIIDSVEHLFDLPRDEATKTLSGLFDALGAGDPSSMLVLIVDSRHLTAIYALSAYDPGIASHVHEIEPVGVVDGLEQMRRLDPGAPSFSPDLVRRLRGDARLLADKGWEPTAELLPLVYGRLRAEAGGDDAAAMDLAAYSAIGGIEGVLRAHLDERLERLAADTPGGAAIASAILELVITMRAEGGRPEFLALAQRLPADLAVVGEVRRRLLEDPDVILLRRTVDRDYELVPPQLGAVIAERIERRQPDVERCHRLIDEGLRSWQQLGVLMPRERFAEVHARRADLAPNEAAQRFLLLCALRHGVEELREATAYWLDRNPNPVDGRDLLLSALFDPDAVIRRRAAPLLTRFADPEVVDRLFLLAVTDPDPDPGVREAVIASLGAIKFEALGERVVASVLDRSHPHRAAAIEVLQVFPDPRVVTVLERLVNDPSEQLAERAMAIRVLSRLERVDAVDALLQIALTDADREDRDEAVAALGTLAAEPLNAHLMERLNVPSGRTRIWLTRGVVGTLAILLGGASVAGLVIARSLGAIPKGMAQPWLTAYVGVSLTALGGVTLCRLRDRRIRWLSVSAAIGIPAFIASVCTVGVALRGLAHASIGRPRRAAALFAVGALGAFFVFVSVWLMNPDSLWARFYLGVGAGLFVLSYAVDVTGALSETVLLAGTVERRRRQASVYRALFANPSAARLLIRDVLSDDEPVRHTARKLLDRYADVVNGGALVEAVEAGGAATAKPVLIALTMHREGSTIRRLEKLYRPASQPLRRMIAGILWSRPSERTLEALDRLAGEMSRAGRARIQVAHAHYPLRIWPWPAWAAVALLVPVAGLLVYHGWNSQMNPAWSEMQLLRSRAASNEARLNAVESLARNHPKYAAPYLLTFLSDSTYIQSDSLYGAIALGLMRAAQEETRSKPQTRRVLLATAGHFERRLVYGPKSFPPSLAVLSGMAAFRDASVRREARRALAAYVNSLPGTSPVEQKRAVITAIGTLPALKALPLLDSLLGANREPAVQTALQQQIERSGMHAIEELAPESVLTNGEPLLQVLSTLHRGSATRTLRNATTSLATTVGDARDNARIACPSAADLRCRGRATAIANALALIDGNTTEEAGYLDLVTAYDTLYVAAAERLIRLRDRYRQSVWPGKTLSMLYLDRLAPRDTSYFARSFTEARLLRSRPSYRDELDMMTWKRFEADFAEIALAAGEFDSMRHSSADLLAVTIEPRYQLNMALFRYIGSVMERDPARARRDLDSLRNVMLQLDPDFYNGESRYRGLSVAVTHSQLPEPMRSALIALCRDGFWFTGREVGAVLERNRRALATLRPSRP